MRIRTADPINLIFGIVSLGFIFAFSTTILRAQFVHLEYPYNTFLFRPAVHFSDFLMLGESCKELNPYFTEIPSSQFPFLNFLSFLFSLLPQYLDLVVFSTLTIAPLIFCLVSACEADVSTRAKVAMIVLLSYPLWFSVDRGNYEGLVAASVLLTLWFFIEKKYALAAFVLGFGSALKIYPIIFLYIFLRERRFKEIGLSILTIIVLSFGSLAAFKGGFLKNFEFLTYGQNFSQASIEGFFFRDDLLQRSVTLYSAIRVAFAYLKIPVDLHLFLKIYKITAVLLFLSTWFLVLRKSKSLVSIGALLVVSIIVLPHLSADYKLLHVFSLLFLFMKDQNGFRYPTIMALLFGFLLIPKPYFKLTKFISDGGVNDLTISLILNPLALMILGYLFLKKLEVRKGDPALNVCRFYFL